MKILLIILAFFCMVSCSNKTQKTVIISKEKMEMVLWDIIRADVFTEQFIKKDTLKKPAAENIKLQNKIFALHKITRQDYNKSYEYYLAHTDLMRGILDSMTAKAERERTKMTEQNAALKIK